MTISLHHFDLALGSTKKTALPLNGLGDKCTVWMRPLPGASSIQLLLEGDNGMPPLRVECQAPNPDSIPICVVHENEGTLHVFRPAAQDLALGASDRFWSRTRNSSRPAVYHLPSAGAYAPPRPICFQENGKLDLLFLVDGSSRLLFQAKRPVSRASPAPAGSATWASQQDKLAEFSQRLRQGYPDLHMAVMAFGDYSLNDSVSAADLRPTYALYPEDRPQQLRALSEQQLKEQLANIPYTSGADFVDALAEALHECQSAGWRADARKLLVLAGDSPGNSILHPLALGADAGARGFDVDSEAAALHEAHGVELLTLYLGDASAQGAIRQLLDQSSKQYERLASHPALFWKADNFDPGAAADVLKNIAAGLVLARGSCYGLLDRIDQSSVT
jgi:hypothetical protein